MSFSYSEILEKLIRREDLKPDEALWLMNQTMSGEFTQAQIAAWLAAMRMKGETAAEIGTFAAVMRSKAVGVSGIRHPVLDTCGTGGDRSGLLNVSTLSALILSKRGVRVAKHGNRSVSSSSGSADILEKLNFNLQAKPEDIAQSINEKNFGFFFAPAFHPAMKFAGPVRKELAIRTVFNVLGPLANPAHAEIHLMGVFSRNYLKVMAEALSHLGAKTFLVVHSRDGLDEISPLQPTDYVLGHDNMMEEGVIDPSRISTGIKNLAELSVKNPEDALSRALSVLAGNDRPGAGMVALNAAAAEFLWELHLGQTSLPLQAFLEERTSQILEKINAGDYSIETFGL